MEYIIWDVIYLYIKKNSVNVCCLGKYIFSVEYYKIVFKKK